MRKIGRRPRRGGGRVACGGRPAATAARAALALSPQVGFVHLFRNQCGDGHPSPRPAPPRQTLAATTHLSIFPYEFQAAAYAIQNTEPFKDRRIYVGLLGRYPLVRASAREYVERSFPDVVKGDGCQRPPTRTSPGWRRSSDSILTN
ncbi:hypothetical protein EVAR_42398_1 [Eumeta japonica]|uniref:Uncharacterized protein n=1 Tax=Eumeta variegata TaxID=151549 RepID=A0A4C1X8I7_EUMVA|nr:hypothetical protein EVAR_42398_1 [Eumeta japonica]